MFLRPSAVRDVLASFPRELLSIVNDYAVEHVWSIDKNQPSVSIDGTKLTCNDIDNPNATKSTAPWYQISSLNSIVDGPDRWSIRCTLGGRGWIAFGITTTGIGDIRTAVGTNWQTAAADTDFLLSTCECADGSGYRYAIVCDKNGAAPLASSFGRKRLAIGESYTCQIETDYQKRTIRWTFDDGTDHRDVLLNVPASLTGVWRPCVSVSGIVTASILSFDL